MSAATPNMISCPPCHRHVEFPPELAGPTVARPHCGGNIALPTSTLSVLAPESQAEPDAAEPSNRIPMAADELGAPPSRASFRGSLVGGVITRESPPNNASAN